jgi:hypothetical protein
MTLAEPLSKFVRAAFTGLRIQSFVHDDAIAEIARLCRQNGWNLAAWDIDWGPNPHIRGSESSTPCHRQFDDRRFPRRGHGQQVAGPGPWTRSRNSRYSLKGPRLRFYELCEFREDPDHRGSGIERKVRPQPGLTCRFRTPTSARPVPGQRQARWADWPSHACPPGHEMGP